MARMELKNETNYKFNENILCVSMDCILMCMRVIWINYFSYPFKIICYLKKDIMYFCFDTNYY